MVGPNGAPKLEHFTVVLPISQNAAIFDNERTPNINKILELLPVCTSTSVI